MQHTQYIYIYIYTHIYIQQIQFIFIYIYIVHLVHQTNALYVTTFGYCDVCTGHLVKMIPSQARCGPEGG